MITFHQLQTFLVLARTGSLTRTARELGASQPTVSLQVKALGQLLGSPLVERHGRGIRLTPAGEALRGYASDVLDGLRALRQQVQAFHGGRAGSLALGASATTGGYVLPSILSAFRARFPQVDVQLQVDSPEHLFHDLLANALDLVFSVGVRAPAGLAVESICDAELVIVVSPHHPLARRRRITAHDLSGQPLVTSLQGALFRELMEEKLRQAGVTPRVATEARHPEAMKKLVEHNMGYSLLFRPSVADELESRRLVALRLPGPPIMGQLIVAFRPQRVASPLVRQFVEFVRAELAHPPSLRTIRRQTAPPQFSTRAITGPTSRKRR